MPIEGYDVMEEELLEEEEEEDEEYSDDNEEEEKAKSPNDNQEDSSNKATTPVSTNNAKDPIVGSKIPRSSKIGGVKKTSMANNPYFKKNPYLVQQSKKKKK